MRIGFLDILLRKDEVNGFCPATRIIGAGHALLHNLFFDYFYMQTQNAEKCTNARATIFSHFFSLKCTLYRVSCELGLIDPVVPGPNVASFSDNQYF